MVFTKSMFDLLPCGVEGLESWRIIYPKMFRAAARARLRMCRSLEHVLVFRSQSCRVYKAYPHGALVDTRDPRIDKRMEVNASRCFCVITIVR